VHLRRDPYERGMVTSNTYDDWFLDRPFLLMAAQDYVGKFLIGGGRLAPPRTRCASLRAVNFRRFLGHLTVY